MDKAAEIQQAHGRVFAARKLLAEFLAKHMDDATVEEAMKMVLDLSAMAHSDGAEWGAVRERTAAQLRATQEPRGCTSHACYHCQLEEGGIPI